ncbi:Ankyrin repeat protein (44), partial [Monkeypox virus]
YDETQDQSTQLVDYDIKLKTNEDDFVDEFYGYDRSVGADCCRKSCTMP